MVDDRTSHIQTIELKVQAQTVYPWSHTSNPQSEGGLKNIGREMLATQSILQVPVAGIQLWRWATCSFWCWRRRFGISACRLQEQNAPNSLNYEPVLGSNTD